MRLYRAGNDPTVDSLALVGRLLEEFMDLPPAAPVGIELMRYMDVDRDPVAEWKVQRDRVNAVLEEHGLQYFRGGRVFPKGNVPETAEMSSVTSSSHGARKPAAIEELLEVIVRNLPRAMYPLRYRRKGVTSLSFDVEADIQDLLHAQLRPWIADIRPEESTPSHGGSSTRMDFLLPRHKTVIETKRVRDRTHAKRISEELIVDIEHYRRHPDCD